MIRIEEDAGSVPEHESGKIEFIGLPALLGAYDSTQLTYYAREGEVLPPGDVDTAEAPGRAMRTFLRTCVHHPGRAARVMFELELLLDRGPEDEILEALSDAGISPEELTPSDGKDPDGFFELMVPHLRDFIEAGERIADAIPESRWEWRERYPGLSGLMSGGFYRDALMTSRIAMRSCGTTSNTGRRSTPRKFSVTSPPSDPSLPRTAI